MKLHRVLCIVAAALSVAACSSSAPVTTASVAPAAKPADVVYAPARTRHAMPAHRCSEMVSAAECRRIWAEGVRLMRASCPASDARCRSVRVVRARRIDGSTAELTVRDSATGQQSVRRVPVGMASPVTD